MSGSVSSSITGSASNNARYQGTLTDRSRTVSATCVSGGNWLIAVPFLGWNILLSSLRRKVRGDHDHGTESPCRNTELEATEMTELAGSPSPLLDAALDQLRLSGAIFFRSELTEPFAFESTPLVFADALHPGAQRLLLFHIVARGTCWVATDDGERHWAADGDVIVLPYGDQHVIGGEAPAECVSIVTLLDPLPWTD